MGFGKSCPQGPTNNALPTATAPCFTNNSAQYPSPFSAFGANVCFSFRFHA